MRELSTQVRHEHRNDWQEPAGDVRRVHGVTPLLGALGGSVVRDGWSTVGANEHRPVFEPVLRAQAPDGHAVQLVDRAAAVHRDASVLPVRNALWADVPKGLTKSGKAAGQESQQVNDVAGVDSRRLLEERSAGGNRGRVHKPHPTHLVGKINCRFVSTDTYGAMTSWEIVVEALARKHKPLSWLAEELRISDQAISHWRTRGVPSGRLRAVAGLLGLTVDQLEGFAQLPWERPVEWPFDDVPRERYFNLAPDDRKQVQAKILEVILEIEETRLAALGRPKRNAPASIGTTPAPAAAKKAKRPRR